MAGFDPGSATEISSDIAFTRPAPSPAAPKDAYVAGGESGSGIDKSPSQMFEPSSATEYVEPEKNFLTDPREHETEAYKQAFQDSYDTKMLEFKVDSDRLQKIKALETNHYKEQRLKDTGELDERWLASVLTPGKSYEIPSISNKLNSMMAKGMPEGDAANELLKMGVQPSELSRAYEYRNGALGYHNDFTQIMRDAGHEISEEAKIIANGFGQAGQALIAMMTKATPVGLVLRGMMGSDNMDKANQVAMAHLDAVEQAYEKQNGGDWTIGGTLAKHSVDIASLGLNPGTMAKAIITGLPFVAHESTMQGYDALQVGAHMALAAAVTGSISGIIGLASTATSLGRKLTKQEVMTFDKAYEKIRVKLGLSPEEMEEVKKAALSTKFTKYADKRNEMEEFFRYMATARHIGNAKGRKAMESVSNTIFTANPHLAQEVMKSATDRANKLLSKVPGSTDLGKLVRVFTRHGDGNTVINWKGLSDAIKDRPMSSAGGQFNASSPIIQMIHKNAEVYSHNDMVSQKLFESEHFINASEATFAEDAINTLKVLAETKATMGVGAAMGMRPIPRYSAARKIVDLVKGHVPGFKGDVKLAKFISAQLSKGSMSAKSLSTELRQFDPHFAEMSTEELNPLVEKMVRLSQETDVTARELSLKTKLSELEHDSKELRLAYGRSAEEVTRAKLALMDEKTPENIARLRAAQYDALAQKNITDTGVHDNTELALRLKSHPLPETPPDIIKELKKPSMMEANIPKPKATELPKRVAPVAKPIEKLETPLNIKQMEKLVRRKMAIGIDGSAASTDAQRAARIAINGPILGKKFASGFERGRIATSAKGIDDKASEDFSNYLIKNSADVTPAQVAQYYDIDPSFVKLDSDRWGFGVPKRIQDHFGIPQKEVVVDRRIAAIYKKNKDGALANQHPDTQIDSRDELAKNGGCK